MVIGSLFSGIGGLELELINQFNWNIAYFADPDKWCKSVLKYHHPNVPNFGNVQEVNTNDLPNTDIIMAGTSCQNFSSQGNREGLKGNKSKLFYEFIRILKNKQPKYALWENVTGATTHADFEIVKKMFKEIGYEIDWDIFNARLFAPTIQQRKRVIMLATRKDINQVRLNRTIPIIKLDEKMQNIKRRMVSISKSHRKNHIDVRINKGIANTLVTGWGCSGMSTKNYINDNNILRDLDINVCELLMTWKKDYTKYGLIDNKKIEIPLTQRFKMCGNGVVSKMLPFLLVNLKEL